jgi:hypothetical protein
MHTMQKAAGPILALSIAGSTGAADPATTWRAKNLAENRHVMCLLHAKFASWTCWRAAAAAAAAVATDGVRQLTRVPAGCQHILMALLPLFLLPLLLLLLVLLLLLLQANLHATAR